MPGVTIQKTRFEGLLRANLVLMLTCLVLAIGCLALGTYTFKLEKAAMLCAKK